MLHHFSLRGHLYHGAQRSPRYGARGVGQGFQPVAPRPVAQYETHENFARGPFRQQKCLQIAIFLYAR